MNPLTPASSPASRLAACALWLLSHACAAPSARPPAVVASQPVTAPVALALDTDRDGVHDDADRCPELPEDCDGVDDADGCPDPDDDHDGVADVCDACPAVVGSAPDGCPRRLIEECRFPAPLVVFFEANAATITPRFVEITEAMARLFTEHPELRRVQVDGHASVGERDPRGLSSRRAEAVLAALVSRGVSASRLVARPYGADDPAMPGSEPNARARNRRVSLQILEADDAPPSPIPRVDRRPIPASCPDVAPAPPACHPPPAASDAGVAAGPTEAPSPSTNDASAVVLSGPFDAPDRWRARPHRPRNSLSLV